jgi:YesN/AraC family two-component response regulator
METIYLNIQNLCCNRCKLAIKELLTNLDIKILEIKSGTVVIERNKSVNQEQIENYLKINGFYLISDKETSIVNQIKCYLSEYMKYGENEKVRMSDFLYSKLNLSYPYLSKIFSKLENTTIEKFFISMKIEKAKELLSSKYLTLSEISYQLGYSSVQTI